ncbi:uncharacterized protein VTP21DRAFT_764 [Calcarisporiella thermophila]|uniref:uncharacterized protein n=1 Tax=Calcarisporiella thermophila TaxID=911321 RepID=UPI0037435CC8
MVMGANFIGCSTQQQNIIKEAIPSAQQYAKSTLSYLESHPSGTNRYKTWNGAYDSGRHETLIDHYRKISSNDFNAFTYDCSCDRPNVYAFVYPNRFGEIHLCPQFWRAPLTGSDSKAGTLVHEAAHFTANGYSRDYAYGQSANRQLAANSPDKALFNSDSKEYLSENNPSLP